MIRLLILLLISIWIYKLIKIIQNSKTLIGFANEFERLSKKFKFSDEVKSERYLKESKNYRTINKKVTRSDSIWLAIEVFGIIAIYFLYLRQYLPINLF